MALRCYVFGHDWIPIQSIDNPAAVRFRCMRCRTVEVLDYKFEPIEVE